MAIVVAGTSPQVVCGLTGHQRTLRDVLNGIPATDGPTKLADAVALARRLIADQADDRKRGQIILCTDACVDGAEKLAHADDVRLLTVGSRTGNVAITQFQVRRRLLDPTGYEILVEIVNFSDEAVKCQAAMSMNVTGTLSTLAPAPHD